MSEYVCHKECYYMETHFKAGDPLPGGLEPNKHFKRLGEVIAEDRPAITAGDDIRSTDEIRASLKELGEKVKEGTSRKVMWAREKFLKGQTFVKPTVTLEELGDDVDPSTLKPFGEMTPDELQGKTCKEIAEHCMAKYGEKVPHTGISKADLIIKVCAIEEQKGQ